MSEELAVIEQKSYALENPAEVMQFGKQLAAYIKDNKLTENIKGKDYVVVEGWQYAGAMLGLTAIPLDIIDVSPGDGKEFKYKSSVKIVRMSDGQQVGAGFAVCSNKEAKKRTFDEYAIASMAQTRAIGKAYRNLLAWIIRAAGYEPTPAEEVPDTKFREHDAPAFRPQDVELPKTFVDRGWPKTVGLLTKTQLSQLIAFCDESDSYPDLADAARACAIPATAK